MPKSVQDRAAELHKLAASLHAAAVTAHEKGDHVRAYELSKEALEQSLNAEMLTAKLAEEQEHHGPSDEGSSEHPVFIEPRIFRSPEHRGSFRS